MIPRIVCAALVALLAFSARSWAQSVDNVLVVINTASAQSVEIGEYYVSRRAIPTSQVIRLTTVTEESVAREDYEHDIELPIATFLTRHNFHDQILYIVLTKGVPLRVNGTGGRAGTVASVDSELTLLYRRLLGQLLTLAGSMANPLYLGDKPIGEAKPTSRFDSDIYLVTRLDGFTVDDAKALVDRSIAATPRGAFVLDQKATLPDAGGDAWLRAAAARLEPRSGQNPVVLETSRALASVIGPVIGYYSWGSNDPANQLRSTGLTFSPGAIGGAFVSADGRTLLEPPRDWRPSGPDGGPVFRGSFQSLAGDLIRDGLTGVAAHVAEPFLDATPRPQILFPAYAAGLNLADAFYRSIPMLGWQTIVLGDPLCRPFEGKPLAPSEITKGIDADSNLPAIFTERRMAALSEGGKYNPAALKLFLRTEARIGSGESVDREAVLVEITTLEPGLVAAHKELALFYSHGRQYAKAIERYRRVLALSPDDVMALNNIALHLAEQGGAPNEGLRFAERAYRASRQAPLVTDTLGWVYYLTGDPLTAAAYLEAALRALPNHPDVLIHAATVHLAVKDLTRARNEIRAASRLGATVTEREDFKALWAQLLGP